MRGRSYAVPSGRTFVLPKWLMGIIVLNIISIIAFLVLLPDTNRPSNSVIEDFSRPLLNPIYFCWPGKDNDFSSLNWAALESAALFHPSRALIVLVPLARPIDSRAHHLRYNISFVHSRYLTTNEESLASCLLAALPLLIDTGGSLFPLDLIWSKSSAYLPPLVISVETSPVMCRSPEDVPCISEQSRLLLINIPPAYHVAQSIYQHLKQEIWPCSYEFSDNSKLALVYQLPVMWTETRKEFDVIRSMFYAAYPVSRHATSEFLKALADLNSTRLFSPKWIAIDTKTLQPLSGIRVTPPHRDVELCLRLLINTHALVTASDPTSSRKLLTLCGSVHQINSNLSTTYLRLDGELDRAELKLSLRVAKSKSAVNTTVPVYFIPKLITIVSKTFGREDALEDLIRSVRSLSDDIPIIAGDDSMKDFSRLVELQKSDEHFKFVKLDFDVGLSAGRNTLLSKVETPYVFLIDDDFVVNSNLNLGMLLYVLAKAQFDILAVRNPSDYLRWGFDFAGKLILNGSILSLESGSFGISEGCQIVDIVPNLFLASTRFLREVPWDPRLKLAEHEEYFLRVHDSGGKVGNCPLSSVCHRWHSSESYEVDRRRQQRFFKIALHKHKLTQLRSFGGAVVAELKPGEEVNPNEAICPLGFAPSWRGGCTSCANGFEGEACDQCSKGFWGGDCQPCGCIDSPCSDGRNGTGCVCAADRHGTHCDIRFPVGPNRIASPIGSDAQNGSQLNRPWFGFEGGYTLVKDEFQGKPLYAPLVHGVPGGAVAQVVELNQSKPRRIVVSAFSKPLNVSYGPADWYGLWVDCWYENNDFEWGLHVPFQANRRHWQYRELILDLKRTVSSVTVLGMLKQHKGAAVFADISIREETEN